MHFDTGSRTRLVMLCYACVRPITLQYLHILPKKKPPVSTAYAYLMHAMGTYVDFVKGGKGMSRVILNVLQAVGIDEARHVSTLRAHLHRLQGSYEIESA
jgi:hypothetical protein